jgi:hypothetical protein
MAGPDELRDEQISRMIVELEWCAVCLTTPSCITTMRSAIVMAFTCMRHVYRRRFQPLVQCRSGAHRDPQLGVKVRQRLVKQKQPWDRARWRVPWRHVAFDPR